MTPTDRQTTRRGPTDVEHPNPQQASASADPIRPAVRRTPLVLQVSAELRGMIESGRWPVGEKIPGEHELAATLGVSRATVREALRGLSITGLLEPRIGDGTYVRATNEITGVLLRDESPSMLDHTLDARIGLEATSARLAAQHATAPALDALQAALDARTRARDSGDLDAYVTADSAFHRAVVEASGNPILLRLHAAVAEAWTASIEQTATLPEDPDVGARLVQQIRDRDPDAAERTAHALIASVRLSGRAGDEPPRPA